MITFSMISILPDMFNALNYGITGRAIENKLIDINLINPRQFTEDRHQTVDDRPYGGGPGMVMMFEPLNAAIESAKKSSKQPAKVIYLSPQGQRLDQRYLDRLTSLPHIILLAGRYEGIDERLLESVIDEECSIGDYVLSGGELAAMVLIDAITRLLPGALGDETSAEQDSFVNDLLDYPHYTRPEIIQNMAVPEVLLSGNHAFISRWRLKQSLGRTWLRRPDLLAQKTLSLDEQKLLDEFIAENTLEK